MAQGIVMLFLPVHLYILLVSDVHVYVNIRHQIFHKRMPPEAVDLVSRLLQYSPNLRSTAVSI